MTKAQDLKGFTLTLQFGTGAPYTVVGGFEDETFTVDTSEGTMSLPMAVWVGTVGSLLADVAGAEVESLVAQTPTIVKEIERRLRLLPFTMPDSEKERVIRKWLQELTVKELMKEGQR